MALFGAYVLLIIGSGHKFIYFAGRRNLHFDQPSRAVRIFIQLFGTVRQAIRCTSTTSPETGA